MSQKGKEENSSEELEEKDDYLLHLIIQLASTSGMFLKAA